LNGVAARANLNALALGRLAAHSADDLFDLADTPSHEPHFPRTLVEVTESRTKLLAAYQDEAYAAQYRTFLDETAATLKARGLGDCEAFLTEVARGLGRLMAYKDEYEVARLYSDPAFTAALRDQFAGNPRLKVNLGSPLISWTKDAKTGRPKKVALDARWLLPAFRLLARFKGLRGGAFDPFRFQADRRLERALISEYRNLIREVAAKVTPASLHTAVEIAAAAELVAGYGPVKEQGIVTFRARVGELLPKLNSETATPAERVSETT
jgi:indolepyruvate ferredoxin oxidoreductase